MSRLSHKTLAVIGLLWLTVAIFAYVQFPDVIVGVHAHGRGAVATAEVALMEGLLAAAVAIFLFGWTVPLGLGIFRFMRRR